MGGASFALTRPVPAAHPIGPNPTTPVPVPVTTAPSAAPSPSASATGTADCTPADLDPRPIYGWGVAMGTAGGYVVVRNVSTAPCLLHSFPTLYDNGNPVPARHDGTAPPDLTLAPGHYAQLLALMANGYPGSLSSDSPQCQHPQDYRDLSLGLGDGQRFPLPGLRIRFWCGDLRVGGWAAVSDVNTEIPNPTRAP
jgi:uncharacterized protein DUF4232